MHQVALAAILILHRRSERHVLGRRQQRGPALRPPIIMTNLVGWGIRCRDHGRDSQTPQIEILPFLSVFTLYSISYYYINSRLGHVPNPQN